MIKLDVNGAERSVDAAADTPLLWVLRDHLNLTGTKFGCGVAACGACTVHVDGAPVRSCVMPVAAAAGRKVRTIEGLAGQRLSALQQAWIRHQVPQCGYCQSGMLMAASALLAKTPAPTDADIDREITNICRCGTYQRIRAAILEASKVKAAPEAQAAGSEAPATAVSPPARVKRVVTGGAA
jgi:isoquinoline 1-oxidoreductase alpha subunit